mgnify:CR=1 FL=1
MAKSFFLRFANPKNPREGRGNQAGGRGASAFGERRGSFLSFLRAFFEIQKGILLPFPRDEIILPEGYAETERAQPGEEALLRFRFGVPRGDGTAPGKEGGTGGVIRGAELPFIGSQGAERGGFGPPFLFFGNPFFPA